MIEVDLMEAGATGFGIHGNVGDYRFQAQMFHDHGENQDWVLADSKISRLWIQHEGRTVFRWDRGPDAEAANDEVQDLVVLLCCELSILPYKPGDRIRLLEMDDPDPVPTGSTGTINSVRNMGEWLQIDVQWDSGRTLMLSVPPDRVEIC